MYMSRVVYVLYISRDPSCTGMCALFEVRSDEVDDLLNLLSTVCCPFWVVHTAAHHRVSIVRHARWLLPAACAEWSLCVKDQFIAMRTSNSCRLQARRGNYITWMRRRHSLLSLKLPCPIHCLPCAA
jgi:hypothetical protein